MKVIKDNGKNRVIISGVISWILVNRNESAKNIWKLVANNHWRVEEITTAKKALRDACGKELTQKVPEMKSNRQKSDAKAEKELKNINAAIDYLTEAKKMPLVLATAGQIQRGPKALGSVEPGASMGDLVSKIAAMESCMTKFMESVNDKFKGVTDDIAKQKTFTDSSIKTVIKEV